jgi:DHA3 family macrolide efflux protein-like MFS transporter
MDWMPLGLILSGSFADVIGVENWFLISGIMTVGIALICYIRPSIRKLS